MASYKRAASEDPSVPSTVSHCDATLQSCCDACRGQADRVTGPLTTVPLCTKACFLLQNNRTSEWRNVCDAILKWMCAALNSCPEGERKGWLFLIHLQDYEEDVQYLESFTEKIDDKLVNLLPQGLASDVYRKFMVKLNKLLFLHIEINGHASSLAIKDGHSSEIVDRGLVESNKLDISKLCYYLYDRPKTEHTDLPQRLEELSSSLTEGDLCKFEESAHLQLKCLRQGDNENAKCQGAKAGRKFLPERGCDCVEWLWEVSKRTIQEYVSAFAKNHKGGIYYCGFTAKKKKKTKDLIGYKVRGLELLDEWQDEILSDLVRRIRQEMLWLERDPHEKNGYREVTPVANRHFAIDLIPVTRRETSLERRREDASKNAATGLRNRPATEKGTATKRADHSESKSAHPPMERHAGTGHSGSAEACHSQQGSAPVSGGRRQSSSAEAQSRSLYVLEVRVAPFNGIVFCRKDGIETYTLAEVKGEHTVKEMPREMWEEKVRSYAWCLEHRQRKQQMCDRCLLFRGQTTQAAAV